MWCLFPLLLLVGCCDGRRDRDFRRFRCVSDPRRRVEPADYTIMRRFRPDDPCHHHDHCDDDHHDSH